jgi:hypothetical protein
MLCRYCMHYTQTYLCTMLTHTSALYQGEEEKAPEESNEEPIVGADFRRSIAQSIIAECLGKRFDQRVEECRQQRLSYKFAAQHCVRTLDALIHVSFSVHDPSDKAVDATWHGGEEPAPVVMDTWARGEILYIYICIYIITYTGGAEEKSPHQSLWVHGREVIFYMCVCVCVCVCV